jgi:hypothetical protein
MFLLPIYQKKDTFFEIYRSLLQFLESSFTTWNEKLNVFQKKECNSSPGKVSWAAVITRLEFGSRIVMMS